ncbi:hypothetical protein [Pseudomonas peli]|uniref:hypothetical protein n=1 Tax=Pseudomonas peli TaxID=592361 RepID=UPI003D15BE16
MKRVLAGAVSVLLLTELYFWEWADGLRGLVIGTVVFFTAFNLLEASLPSLVSKVSPAGGKGTAMGVYSTSQFLGRCPGRDPWWLVVPARWAEHGVPRLRGTVCHLAGRRVAHERAALCDQPAHAADARGSPGSRPDRAPDGRAGCNRRPVVAEEAAIYIKLDTKILDRTTLERLVNPASSACEA